MLVIAHRCGSCSWPENTVAAAKEAWGHDVDGIEVEVLATKKAAEVVVFHDKDTERLTGKKVPVYGTTLDDLKALDLGMGQRIATLSEILETVPEGKKGWFQLTR